MPRSSWRRPRGIVLDLKEKVNEDLRTKLFALLNVQVVSVDGQATTLCIEVRFDRSCRRHVHEGVAVCLGG